MARRKRLTLPDAVTGPDDPLAMPPQGSRATSFTAPPIARVAAETSATAALGDLAEAWAQARDSGRMVQDLPLEAIDEGWLVRDRITLDSDEIADLTASIRARGQQVPIEVVALEGGRYGLISGWRRLRALKGLHAGPEGARFATVLALLRKPSGPAEAYRAMVEENEIRANLSYYERARIAARAAEAGAFDDARAAIASLFAAGSRAKRSKIASFLTLVEGLDDRLRFAWTIPERLGLQLARALETDPDLRGRLRERLRKTAPADAEAELALLARSLEPAPRAGTGRPAGPKAAPHPGTTAPDIRREELRPGLWLETEGGPSPTRLALSGDRVDADLRARLVAWLRSKS